MKCTFRYHGPANRLTSSDGARIVADLQEFSPTFEVRKYFGSQPGIFESYDHAALAYDPERRCRGIFASRWFERDGLKFLYLWTAMIATGDRRTGVFKALVARHFKGVLADTKSVPSLVATKTYNPVIYAMLMDMLGSIPGVELHPRVDGGNADAKALTLSTRIARELCPTLEYRADVSVIVGAQAAVAPNYFPELPSCSNFAVRNHFERHVSRDDQVLCVLRLSEEAKGAVAALLNLVEC